MASPYYIATSMISHRELMYACRCLEHTGRHSPRALKLVEEDYQHDTGGSEAMPLIQLSVQHGHTFDEAKRRLETAVHEIQSRFSTLVQQVEWSTDRSQVRLEGIGFWIEMQVDAQVVHVSADIPVLGRLLGGSVTTRLKEIVQRTFQLKLPEGNEKA
jgi:Putative polyhydroxyalkanoic acid system protein (PHA_gran_rgn)